MSNPDIEFDVAFTDRGKIIKEKTDPMIVKYCEMNKKYQFALNDAVNGFSPEDSSKSRMRRNMKYQNISREIVAELSSYGYSDVEIADVLVKFLYGIKNGKNKMALWLCYGDIVYNNISRNIKRKTKDIQCVDCGKWFEIGIFDSATERCDECLKEHKRELKRLEMQRYRQRKRGVGGTL